MNRITRQRPLSPEEAAKYNSIREQVAEELPDLIARHQEREAQRQDPPSIPSVSVQYAGDGSSTKSNALGMRPMQERAWQRRGEQYLLIKSPPASGKSRALMFIALDKLHNQKLKQAIIVVPEKAIGASFHAEPLSQFGFWADWHVEPKWNLCDAPGADNGGKVEAVKKFLGSADNVLVCTHATFRFAVEKFGVEVFDERLIAVDEFHHVSAHPDSRLGDHVRQFMERDKTHIVAMTGSYFRGDGDPVLHPDDEARFDTVTYTYYEQLNGYQYLKQLDIGYYFYAGPYTDEILKVLDPSQKTIVHIPNVNARESTKDKIREVEHIIEELGAWQGVDPTTGFQLVQTADGNVLKIADLVDDEPAKREKVSAALRDPAQKNNRAHVDIIIALGMAKEGFDWIWCEHALTVGYRSSLTEIVQIIGRATRDAPGKTRARFTNLIAEPDASEDTVTEAVNDTLKAIAASLLMEQVLAPRFEFRPKHPNNQATPGLDYGEDGYDPDKCNVGVNPETGSIQLEIKGLAEPKSQEAERICREDLTELVTAFVQDKDALERGLFDSEIAPEELTQLRMGKIVKEKFPNQFKPIFEEVQHELETGRRQTVKYKDNAEVVKGALFILGGQKVLVADVGEPFISDYGRPDRRLRVVYDNGTESDLLVRSLQRALNKDKASRRLIIEADTTPLFSDEEEEGDLATGYIYVLRSKSDHPFVVQHRDLLHKIGVTGGDVKSRVANAKKDPTYLLADVEIVATFKLANVNRKKLEGLLHKIFHSARLDLELKDRFGSHVEPREWFLVPLSAIDEAIQRIKDGTIEGFLYDPETARLTRA